MVFIYNLTPQEAKNHGYPPVGFSMNSDCGWMDSKFRRKDELLQLSGPPGGPLDVRVFSYSSPTHMPQILKKIVEMCFFEPFQLRPEFESSVQLKYANTQRHALTFCTGTVPPVRAMHCAILLSSDKKLPFGVVVLFTTAAGKEKPNLQVICKHPSFKAILSTFQLQEP